MKKNNNIINKSRNCLKKVYNTFLSKASILCNIISKQNKKGQIKDQRNEINDIILPHTYKNQDNNQYFWHLFYNLEISFHLKRNIINNFIEEIPLNNLLQYTNLNNNF